MVQPLQIAFGVLGNATALFLFLAPLVTFWSIIKNRSTQQFSGVPYVATMLNCVLSAWYGLPFISSNNLLVSTINATGTIIEAFYVLVFIVYAPTRREKLKIFGLLTVALLAFGTIAVVSVLVLHDGTRKLLCGVAATVFSICMYASPLSIMRLVIKTKSVEFMPFFLSLFVFLCGTSWFIFGILGNDMFIAVPNGFGTALGAAQLILYAMFRKPSENGGTDSVINDGQPEMQPSKGDYEVQELQAPKMQPGKGDYEMQEQQVLERV